MADKRFEEWSKTISSAAESMGKRTEAFLEMQRIKSQIHSAQRAAQKSCQELGELVYKRYQAGEAVDEDIHVICEDISQFMRTAEELREDLASRKGKKICPVCQAEVDVESVYCMKCGSRIVEETASEEAEEADFVDVEAEETDETEETNEAEETDAAEKADEPQGDEVPEESEA